MSASPLQVRPPVTSARLGMYDPLSESDRSKNNTTDQLDHDDHRHFDFSSLSSLLVQVPPGATTTTIATAATATASNSGDGGDADADADADGSKTSSSSNETSSASSSSSGAPKSAAVVVDNDSDSDSDSDSDDDDPLLDIDETGRLFVQATKYAIWTWIGLLVLLYTITDPDDLVYLNESERRAAQIAFCSLATATILMLSPVMIQNKGKMNLAPLIRATIVVQSIAMITNFILAFCPNIVVIDPVTHSPVYLIRWTEFIPLSGLMTFLCEGVAIKQPLRKKKRNKQTRCNNDIYEAAKASIAQSISCLMGGIFVAYCTNIRLWIINMSLSCVTCLYIIPRVMIKRREYMDLHAKFSSSKNKNKTGSSSNNSSKSYVQQERYDRLKFSYHMMLTCSIVWSILVVFYVINAAIHRSTPSDHWIREYSTSMIADTFFDMLAKGIYMRCIVDVHFAVFDSEGRAMRQLGELQGLMTVLWDTTSDVIIVSILDTYENKLISIMSPSFLNLIESQMPKPLQDRPATALLLEMTRTSSGGTADNPQCTDSEWSDITKAQYIDATEAPYRRWVKHTILDELPTDHFVAKMAQSFVVAAWHQSNKVVHNNTHTNNNNNNNNLQKQQQKEWYLKPHRFVTQKEEERISEIKVSNHGRDAIIGVVRDITERYRWFEAERRAHDEVLRRQKDAQSQTRFVRHEVKNGLLAGIELCDSLRNEIDSVDSYFRGGTSIPLSPTPTNRGGLFSSIDNSTRSLLEDSSFQSTFSDTSHQRGGLICPNIDASRKRVSDLDLLLHEVLETVLHEAMARDVIHEVYKPRVERLDVVAVLSSSVSTKSGKSNRFPIQSEGDLPFLQADSQLLRYIHRNAISNSTKYGKSGGKVDTVLAYHTKTKTLEMKVVNEPGVNHESFLKMTKERYNDVVFSQGTSLHDPNDITGTISSGDGAWIMQKCAKTMGGSCSITFHDDHTEFIFLAPAEPLVVSDIPETKDFTVPSHTLGIAIDDSKIQRKMMGRILSHIGVGKDNIHILGESPSEIMGLQDLIFGLLEEHPTSSVLILIDENLDYGISSTDGEHVALSGSIIMQGILEGMNSRQEKRVLALVRSANDSTTDVACYSERTHGFFPKAPMQKERVREIIAPLWADRFMAQ